MGSIVALAFWLVLCLGIAWIGSLLTRPAIPDWYATLTKPTWTPPNWVFAPAWTTLYILMAVAAWLVWEQKVTTAIVLPLAAFLVQLLLNIAWSALFFRFHLPGAAMVEIIVLWFSILVTLILFWRVSSAAGWLLVPYLIWVAYATSLNIAIWRLNE
jgi:benzodiazapine receptor